MAYYVMGYLYNTCDMPLVLGGNTDFNIHDASHGTGPRSRSMTGVLVKLHPDSGAVHAVLGQSTVKLLSFESELDGTTTVFKTLTAAEYDGNV